MKLVKTTLIAVAVVVAAGQFIRPPKNISAQPSPDDITLHHPTPPEVTRILQVACYDCHSDNTRYPWYAEIQPVGWWLYNHVEDGKRHLNFSEFAAYTAKRADHKMEEFIELVGEREMPLASYTLAHADARLTDAQIKLLNDWTRTVRARITTTPAD